MLEYRIKNKKRTLVYILGVKLIHRCMHMYICLSVYLFPGEIIMVASDNYNINSSNTFFGDYLIKETILDLDCRNNG